MISTFDGIYGKLNEWDAVYIQQSNYQGAIYRKEGDVWHLYCDIRQEGRSYFTYSWPGSATQRVMNNMCLFAEDIYKVQLVEIKKNVDLKTTLIKTRFNSLAIYIGSGEKWLLYAVIYKDKAKRDNWLDVVRYSVEYKIPGASNLSSEAHIHKVLKPKVNNKEQEGMAKTYKRVKPMTRKEIANFLTCVTTICIELGENDAAIYHKDRDMWRLYCQLIPTHAQEECWVETVSNEELINKLTTGWHVRILAANMEPMSAIPEVCANGITAHWVAGPQDGSFYLYLLGDRKWHLYCSVFNASDGHITASSVVLDRDMIDIDHTTPSEARRPSAIKIYRIRDSITTSIEAGPEKKTDKPTGEKVKTDKPAGEKVKTDVDKKKEAHDITNSHPARFKRYFLDYWQGIYIEAKNGDSVIYCREQGNLWNLYCHITPPKARTEVWLPTLSTTDVFELVVASRHLAEVNMFPQSGVTANVERYIPAVILREEQGYGDSAVYFEDPLNSNEWLLYCVIRGSLTGGSEGLDRITIKRFKVKDTPVNLADAGIEVTRLKVIACGESVPLSDAPDGLLKLEDSGDIIFKKKQGCVCNYWDVNSGGSIKMDKPLDSIICRNVFVS